MNEKINVKDELKKIKPRPPKEIIYRDYKRPENGTDYVKILKYEEINGNLELYLNVTHYPDSYIIKRSFLSNIYYAKWIVPRDTNNSSNYHLILFAASKNRNKLEGLDLVVTSNRIRKKGLKDSIKRPGKKQELIKPHSFY